MTDINDECKSSCINRDTLAALSHDPAALVAFVRGHGTHDDGSQLIFMRAGHGGGMIVRGWPQGDKITIQFGSPLIPVSSLHGHLDILL